VNTVPDPSSSGVHKRATFWDMLEEGDRQALQAAGNWKVYGARKLIVDEGDPSEFAVVIQTGWVKITRRSTGGERTALALRGPGDLVGECASDGQARTASVTALNEVQGWCVLADQLSAFLDTCPAAAHALRRTERDRRMEIESAQIGVQNANGDRRLARLLLELADNVGRFNDGRPGLLIDVPLSKDELGQLISVKRSTVDRALADWRERKFVTTGYQEVTLLNQPELRRIAGLDY
jgi:CRP/FNR family cyclic AMP-dependent transcriptional regulator